MSHGQEKSCNGELEQSAPVFFTPVDISTNLDSTQYFLIPFTYSSPNLISISSAGA
jgi:hypothetical protein